MDKQLSIADWVAKTKSEKSGWSEFYRHFLGRPLSDIPRFFKAVENFGHPIMFESVIAASTKKLDGDPLNYVIGIAISKAGKEASEADSDERYRLRMIRAKERIIAQNEELEAKIERAKKVQHESTEQEG